MAAPVFRVVVQGSLAPNMGGEREKMSLCWKMLAIFRITPKAGFITYILVFLHIGRNYGYRIYKADISEPSKIELGASTLASSKELETE